MTDDVKPDQRDMRLLSVLSDLDRIIDDEKTTVPDRLKAIAMKAEFLGLKPTSGAGPDSSIPFDISFNEAMIDPILRKRAAKLAEDTQKAIEKLTEGE